MTVNFLPLILLDFWIKYVGGSCEENLSYKRLRVNLDKSVDSLQGFYRESHTKV